MKSCKLRSNPYAQISKNSVEAKNQLKDSPLVRFDNPSGRGVRIMIVGNSITRHGPAPAIEWYGDYGMAASDREHDFVSLTEREVRSIYPDAAFCICQVAEWERQYKVGERLLEKFESARDFCADIIVLRFVENIKLHDEPYDPCIFRRELSRLVGFIDKTGSAKIIVTTGFWRHPADAELRAYASEGGYPLIELGDLGERDEYKAMGLFKHEGVANHPSDVGMAAIAERITPTIKQYL